MSMEKRIQRKRARGWRMPEGAVYVGRPTRWGNPYTLGAYMDPVGLFAENVRFSHADLASKCPLRRVARAG